MSSSVQPVDAVVAGMLERLAGVSNSMDACSTVLDCVLPETGFNKAILLTRHEEGFKAVGWAVSPEQVDALVTAAQDPGSTLLTVVARGHGPEPLTGHAARVLDFNAPLAIPFPGVSRTGLGVLVVDGAADDPDTELASQLLRRAAPALSRCLQIEAATARLNRLDRQRDLLTGIVNALTDPVVLTNAENNILLTNLRAERLFTFNDQDSEGRRRAVQINNLLFSSFLTQAVIGGKQTARELNLVDPTEGSDLLFEVITTSVAYGVEGSVISILRDITDLKRAVTQLESEYKRSRSAEHRAREERDRLNVVLENVSDPILLTDHSSNILLMNPEADRLFVVTGDAEPETPWSRLVRANDTKFTGLISDFLLQGEQRRVERLNLVDPDNGREFPAEVASSKIMNARGEPIAIVSV